ncbi:metal-dependent hydrolase [Thermodesulfovibrio thiophilus]|uniref:metal-dependent hydrolase n=1 Tax=Thermodesulfovibrio thiophilus TaxID=340095 RepID=UPI000491F76B|nr:metal-dependent hydrolase [Thermodesulfovibrio thiophilus]
MIWLPEVLFILVTWKSHKIVTFCVVYVLSHNPVFSLLAAIGSVVPDLIEGRGFVSMNPYKQYRWQQNHRKLSHWCIPYIAICLICLFILRQNSLKVYSVMHLNQFLQFPELLLVLWISFAVSSGAVMHIFEDALSGKVPLFNPKRKNFGIRLIPVNSLFELIFTLTVVFVTMALLIIRRQHA